MAGTPGSRRQEDMIRDSDQKTRVLVRLGERDECPCDIVVADQVENQLIYSAFASVHSPPPLDQFPSVPIW